MPNIFAPPVATHWTPSASWHLPSASHKRKRQKVGANAVQDEERQGVDTTTEAKTHPRINLEYTAVVTPQERYQRHVAGQPLDQDPPQFPFPHAEDASANERTASVVRMVTEGRSRTSPASRSSDGLHLQHLGALTAIIHRSLLREDFPRASRALGLLFREDAVHENAAVRNLGFMGIAAEVLLRNGCSRAPTADLKPGLVPFTREGFEKAKRLYERLIVQHPYHKSWPNAVNAVDFYLATFNLWICVIQAESTLLSEGSEDNGNNTEGYQKMRELEQARQVASKMDSCMATVPYMDEPELIRLRAMVALWTADLLDDCASLAIGLEAEMDHAIQDEDGDSHQAEHEATLARDKARGLFAKLEGRPISDDA